MQHEETERLADFRITSRTLYLCALALIVGIMGALIAMALTRMIGFFTNLFFYHRLSFDFITPYPNHLGIGVVLVPVIGALMIGFMARYGSEKIRGHGIPEAMEAILIGKSIVSPKVAILKPISAAISIGSGGPFGAEGPIIMSGSSFGSLIGQLLHLTASERKVLLLSGAAAGMSATFHAPIASVLFTVELLAFEYRLRSLVPIALASGVADLIRVSVTGAQPIFPSTVVPNLNPEILLTTAAFGLAGALLAYVLTRAIYGVEDLFERLPIHWMWWPAIGGVVIGLGGYLVPQALGVGYDTIGQLVTGSLMVKVVLAFLLVKAIIWIVALGSGTSGGILAPLLIIGGTLGYGSAQLFHATHPGAWAIMGMAALFAGVTRSPLTTVVFLLELTHDMAMLFPTLIICAVASVVSAILLPRSILTEKIARRGRHVARDYVVHPLELQKVGQVIHHRNRPLPDPAEDCPRISSQATVMSAMHKMLEYDAEMLVIVDEGGGLSGVVTKDQILEAGRHHLEEETRKERILRLPGLRQSPIRIPESGKSG